MKLAARACLKAMLFAILWLLTGAASAHPLHGGSFMEGLVHPVLGLDHLLAMIAVGAWARQQGEHWRWAIPAGFVIAMVVGGIAAASGSMALITVSTVESLVAASVVIVGLLLAMRARRVMAGAVVLAGFAVFHGAAHMADIQPPASVIEYVLGFVVATSALVAAGLAAGAVLSRTGTARWAGAGVAAAGLWLLRIAG